MVNRTEHEGTPRKTEPGEVLDLRVVWIESNPERPAYGATPPAGPSEFRRDTVVSGGKRNDQGTPRFGLGDFDVARNRSAARDRDFGDVRESAIVQRRQKRSGRDFEPGLGVQQSNRDER